MASTVSRFLFGSRSSNRMGWRPARPGILAEMARPQWRQTVAEERTKVFDESPRPEVSEPARSQCSLRANHGVGTSGTLYMNRWHGGLRNVAQETEAGDAIPQAVQRNRFSSAFTDSRMTWPTIARLRGLILSRVSWGVCQ